MPTGAQLILGLLEERDVEVCFGLPGVHNLPLWEALRDSPIRLIGVRHEQAAAYAADGYARATGKLGVALTTTGPGAANTLAAVGEAWASRSPVLVIATDIPSGLRRPGVYRGVLHETTARRRCSGRSRSPRTARWRPTSSRPRPPPRSPRRSPSRSGPCTWRSPPTCSAPMCRTARPSRGRPSSRPRTASSRRRSPGSRWRSGR